MNPRLTIHHIVTEVIVSQHSLDSALQHFNIADQAQQRALIQASAFGLCRFLPRLQIILSLLLQKPLRKKDQDIEILLLLGLFQIIEMRVADHAAVSETVNLCKKLRKNWAKNLVNGVLREFLRQQDELLIQANKIESARYAHPDWLIRRIQSDWPEQYQMILDANNCPAPLTLRVNQLKTTRSAYLSQLHDQQLSGQGGDSADNAIMLDKPCNVSDLPQFSAGHVSVQDEAAQLAASLLQPQPGDRILDACAAPGGKTCHLLELEPNIASLVALDISSQRLDKIRENCERLQLANTEFLSGDAAEPEGWWDKQLFDRILVDAPCSATGVIRRHPDIKILRKDSDIEQLVALQRKILQKLWLLLKPGGHLLYCTCSILAVENTEVIANFLKITQNAQLQEIDANWGIAQSVGRQILPGQALNKGTVSNMDGFYYALLIKE